MKKILVTGGAGFIGKNLILKLLENSDNHIICVDNFYSSDNASFEKLFSWNDRVTLKEMDIVNQNIISTLYTEGRIDEIYHLACPASPKSYQKNQMQTLATSVIGSYNVLQLAYLFGSKILFTSTSEIYGDPLQHPQAETYFGNVNIRGERSCYDEGKRCAETMFHVFNKQMGIKTKTVRIFNTYGEHMQTNDGRVISNFINQAINNQEITIYGTGEQTRSFCYVQDLVDGLISYMGNNIYNEAINLGNDTEITMNEVAVKIIEYTGSNSTLSYNELPKDDPKQRKPDLTKAKQLLNWDPKVSFKDGIIKTINYFKNL